MKKQLLLTAVLLPFGFAACEKKTTTEEVKDAGKDAAAEVVKKTEETIDAVDAGLEHAIDEVEEAVEEATTQEAPETIE